MTDTMTTNALTDVELNEANGGVESKRVGGAVSFIRNSRGDRVGNYNDGWIYYYPCSHCGTPMHAGSWMRAYCDPCDNSELNPDVVEWSGTEAELIAAAEKSY